MDETYAWDFITGKDGFERMTLFENADAQRIAKSKVRRAMIAKLDRLQPEIVAVPGWADAAALAATAWSIEHGAQVVCMSESTEWDETRNVWREAVKRQVVGLFSSALVGGTPHRDYLVKLGMPVERIFLGYDAVDNSYFADKAAEIRNQKSETRNHLALPEKFFLASARFIEKKNLPRLIEAYAHYRTLYYERSEENGDMQQAPWSLLLLGDGELRSDLCSHLDVLGLHTHLQMHGFKQYPELPEYYARAGAFIHASTTEQWGLVVNEAMASGLPVLVSNRCGCARDLVQEGVNGFTFDPYDIKQLAQLMLKLSIDEWRLRAMGKASVQIISEWGPERFAQGLKAAADMALAVGPVGTSLMQRAVLHGLNMR